MVTRRYHYYSWVCNECFEPPKDAAEQRIEVIGRSERTALEIAKSVATVRHQRLSSVCGGKNILVWNMTKRPN